MTRTSLLLKAMSAMRSAQTSFTHLHPEEPWCLRGTLWMAHYSVWLFFMVKKFIFISVWITFQILPAVFTPCHHAQLWRVQPHLLTLEDSSLASLKPSLLKAKQILFPQLLLTGQELQTPNHHSGCTWSGLSVLFLYSSLNSSTTIDFHL